MTLIEELKLTASEIRRDLPEDYSQIVAVLDKAVAEIEALQRVLIERKAFIDAAIIEIQDVRAHSAQSDKELCQLQDALGCPCESRMSSCPQCGWKGHNQHFCPKCRSETRDDGHADPQALSMERIRDLIAKEGEAGDLEKKNTILADALRCFEMTHTPEWWLSGAPEEIAGKAIRQVKT